MIDQLNSFWKTTLNDCSLEADNLKHLFNDRWVRFHSLPESKRYAESEQEYLTILSRHNAVLDELTIGHKKIYLLIPEYSESKSPALPEQNLVELFPQIKPWRSMPLIDIEHEKEFGVEKNPYYLHVHATEITYSGDELNKLIRMVADDEVRNVMVFNPHSNALFHPYDGGADVILRSTNDRDRLKHKFSDWLSTYPGGF